MKLNGETGVGYRDCLLAATMLENGVTKIFTEDRDFTRIPGIIVVNPFKS